jgi:6-pyruvoyltetrahydropterin/6-carboxytetrahydropterin synthase
VLRAYNSVADELANTAMDVEGPVGDYLTPLRLPDALNQEQLISPQMADALELDNQADQNVDKKERNQNMADRQGVYTLSIKEHFDAAHALVGYPGECRNLHGHTWDVEVAVSGMTLDSVGIVFDFKDLKIALMEILDQFDHKYLNEVPPFDTMNATAENLARVIFEQMAAKLPEGIKLEEVAVWESPIARLSYRVG